MRTLIEKTRHLAIAMMLATGLSVATLAATSVVAPQTAEAGVVKKAKKGVKLVGKGAKWAEKKLAKKGKVGKVLAKGARGIRKGAEATTKGIGKAQKGAKKAFGKVCKGKCAKVAKGVKKVGKGLAKLKREAQEKCEKYGRNSRACKVAMNAIEFASPI